MSAVCIMKKKGETVQKQSTRSAAKKRVNKLFGENEGETVLEMRMEADLFRRQTFSGLAVRSAASPN